MRLERGLVEAALADDPTVCQVPPAGWRCTRSRGHDGPCAAVPIVGPKEKVAALYDAVLFIQSDPSTLDLFTRAGQGELNRVGNRAQHVLDSIERDEIDESTPTGGSDRG